MSGPPAVPRSGANAPHGTQRARRLGGGAGPAPGETAPGGTASGGPAGRHPTGGAAARPTAPTTAKPVPARDRMGGDLSEAVRGFALLWLEVERGRRPLRQLRRLVSPELLDRLEQVPVTDGSPARVVRCAGMRTAADVYEGLAVLRQGGRTTVLCVTLRRDGPQGPAWRVTDLGRPGAVPLPPPRWSHERDHDADDAVMLRSAVPAAWEGGIRLPERADWCRPDNGR